MSSAGRRTYQEPDQEWRAVAQNAANLRQLSSENQQALQQVLTKMGQMVTRQELEDILENRFVGRQEFAARQEALREWQQRIDDQPNVTRTNLGLWIAGGGCLATIFSAVASVAMGLLLFGLEHLLVK